MNMARHLVIIMISVNQESPHPNINNYFSTFYQMIRISLGFDQRIEYKKENRDFHHIETFRKRLCIWYFKISLLHVVKIDFLKLLSCSLNFHKLLKLIDQC